MEIRIEQGKKEEREKIRVIKRNGTKQGGRKSKSNAIINQKKKGGEKMGKKEGNGIDWARAVSMAERNVSTLKYSARHRLELLPDSR